tara:strand:+ start:238 stop:753 length:516 start_codon:yes stop_codon:yes gene_type:complete
MKLYSWTIISLVGIALLIRLYTKSQPIFSGPYQAIQCGLNRKTSDKDTFIFDSKNGYLYYFDLAKDEFKPLSQKNNKGIYFYQMEEHSSRLEVNKFNGNTLVIQYIDYLNQEPSQKSITNKTINLRWLVMHTFIKESSGNESNQIDNCIWVDPKKVNTSHGLIKLEREPTI